MLSGPSARLKYLLLLPLLWLVWEPVVYAQNTVPVSVATVQEQPVFRQVQITGTVTSPRVARLSTATSGLVEVLHADLGDRVEAGQVLLELDAELARLQWQSARAQQQQASQALQDSQRRLREAQALAPQRSIAESAVHDLSAEVAFDQATLDQTMAEVAYRQGILSRHHLAAPFSGIISAKLTELGEWINPGDGVFELVDNKHLRLDFAVAEDYLTQLSADTRVLFSLNTAPERKFAGTVSTIVPVTNPGARTFLLRVNPGDGDHRLVPGQSARATLQIPSDSKGLVVPRDATLRYPDGRLVVWSAEQTEKGLIARENNVTLGESFDGLVEIRQGLKPGDTVIVQGNEALQDGQLLRIIARN